MNILFVDIPRTAGTSILSIIGRPEGVWDRIRHVSCRDWVKMIGHQRYEAFDRMTVVRNPITRFLSAYYYLSAEREPGHPFFEADKRERADIGKATLNEVAQWPSERLYRMEHFRPQMMHLIGESGNIEVQHVLRFERLGEAWSEFAGEFGLPPTLPATNASNGDREELTPKSLKCLRDTYAVDFEVLNY